MKKLNSNGFGVVEGLLILVIVGIIGSTGFYVYKVNSNTEESLSNIGRSEIQKQGKGDGLEEKNVDPYEGWKTYESDKLPFSFRYPADWAINGDASYLLEIEAPETKLRDIAIGGTEVEKGAKFLLHKGKNVSFNNLDDYKKSQRLTVQFGTDIKDISVDGRNGFEYKLAYEGPATFGIIFLDKGLDYGLSVEQTVYSKAEYSEIFDKLLTSIDFK